MATKNRNGSGNSSDSRNGKGGSHMSDGPGREGREDGKGSKGFMSYDEVNESIAHVEAGRITARIVFQP